VTDPTDHDGPGRPDAPDADEPAIPQDMAALLALTADLEPPVEVSAGRGPVTYAVGGRIFARVDGRAFEAQLGPQVAAAAIRTPDVTAGALGAGWVRLEPAVIDDHAADRVVAWFELARRIAVGHQVPGPGSGRHA
jgi:hypothetical protein